MIDNSNNQNLLVYNNKNLKIEKNSFNYDNDVPPVDYSLKALKKLDMEHATNNYYNNQVEPPKSYKVFVRRDKKPDFDNYKHFNDYVEFDSEKYQRPEIYYGFVHDQYLMPQILYGNTKNDKQKEGEKLEEKNQEKIIKSDSKKIKNNKKEKTNTVKSFIKLKNVCREYIFGCFFFLYQLNLVFFQTNHCTVRQYEWRFKYIAVTSNIPKLNHVTNR